MVIGAKKMGIKRYVLIAVLCFVMLGSLGVTSRAAGLQSQVDITADTIDYDETRGEVRLIGNVKVSYDGAVITSSYARYMTKQQEAHFQGQVQGVYGETTITGSQLTAYLPEHRAVLCGHVHLVTTQAITGESATPTTLEAETLTYNWQNRLAIAQGKVAVEQGGRHAYAEAAEYNERAHTIALKGNVRFEQSRNDWLMSESVVMDLTKKRIEAQGRVSGRFVIASGNVTDSSAATIQLPEVAPIEPAPQTQTVEDVSPLLLPGLQE